MSGASTVVKTAALAMMGTALALFSANAQQFAATTQPDYSACDQMSATNPLGATRCRVDTLQAHTRQLRAESAQLSSDSACSNELVSRGRADPAFVQRGRAILARAGKSSREYGACNLLRALTQG